MKRYICKKINSLRYFIELAYNGAGYHGWQISLKLYCSARNGEGISLLIKVYKHSQPQEEQMQGSRALLFAHFDYDKIIEKSLIFLINQFYQKILSFIIFYKCLAMMLMPGLMPCSSTYQYKLARSKIHFLLIPINII